MSKEARCLLALFILLVAAKVILVLLIPAPSAFSDNYYYAKMARSFFYDLEFSVHGNPVQKYPPLYAMVLSPAYLFKDMEDVYLAMKVINVLASTAIVFPAWLLSRRFMGKRLSFATALLVSVTPASFIFPTLIMAENILYPLFTAAAYLIYRSANENKNTAIAGVFTGLAVLTKFSATVLVLAAIILLAARLRLKQLVIFCIFLAVTVAPWLLRNIMLSGFNMDSISGGRTKEATVILNSSIPSFAAWVLLYTGYIVLASGILFFIACIMLWKDRKCRHMLIFTSLLTALVILLAANHNLSFVKYETMFGWLTGRPLGRYVDLVLPLILINGVAGLKHIRLNTRLLLPISAVTAFSAQLIFFPLLPFNNMSLAWAGALKTLLQGSMYGTSTTVLLFFTFLFGLLPFLAIMLHRKLKWKVIYAFTIFFLLVSLANFAMIYYNSYRYWYSGDQMQLGLWLNRFDPETATVLFDVRDCTSRILKLDQNTICEKEGATIMGFWLNDEIKIGDINTKADYVISRHELGLKRLKSMGGVHIYKK